MKIRWIRVSLTATTLIATLSPLGSASAADGLVAPPAATLWPRWQARIAVQAASLSPLSVTQWVDGSVSPRGLRGGAVLGDYYFGEPSFGGFRASGGLLTGWFGGLPQVNPGSGSRLGLAISSSPPPQVATYGDGPGTLPYLGLGYTGATGSNGLAITADFGLVAEHPSAAGGLGRAIFGNQGLDSTLRDLRLSPVLQLGVSYTF